MLSTGASWAVFWYILALDMFGRSDSKRTERCTYWGLKRRIKSRAREGYIDQVNPLIKTGRGLLL